MKSIILAIFLIFGFSAVQAQTYDTVQIQRKAKRSCKARKTQKARKRCRKRRKAQRQLAFLRGLSDANSAFITADTQNRYISRSTSRLFVSKKSGIILEVEQEDERGRPVKVQLRPKKIHDTKKFIFVEFDRENVLVRKSDERVFSLKEFKFPSRIDAPIGCGANKVVQTDDAGNIYFVSEYRGTDGFGELTAPLFKLDVSNPDVIVATNYNNISERVHKFLVDGEGNVIFHGLNGDSNITRIKTRTDRIHILPNVRRDSFWLDVNGVINYSKRTDQISSEGYYQIFRVDITPDGSINHVLIADGEASGWRPACTTAKVFLGKKTLLFGKLLFHVIDPELATVTGEAISVAGIDIISKLVVGSNNYYVFGYSNQGIPRVSKVSITDHSAITLSNDKFDVTEMTVMAGEELMVSAVRLADSVKILCKFTRNNEEIVLDEVINEAVATLIPISISTE